MLGLRHWLRSASLPWGMVAALVFLWCYWTTFAALIERWSNSPHYSHGFVVPVVAGAILWIRRQQWLNASGRGRAWGLLLLGAGAGLRLGGAFYYYPWLDELSLLPSLTGLCVLLGGWPALRGAWPAVAFLVFMLPLPFFVETALAHPLQELATEASTYVLQTLGYPALAEGNIVVVNSSRIDVAAACNGLGMLVVFFAISTALAFLVSRPLWERAVLLLSAIPVALFANVVRITVTAILSDAVNSDFGQTVFHDWGGWLMMPLALLLLWGELKLGSWLVVAPRPAGSSAHTVVTPWQTRSTSSKPATDPKACREGPKERVAT